MAWGILALERREKRLRMDRRALGDSPGRRIRLGRRSTESDAGRFAWRALGIAREGQTEWYGRGEAMKHAMARQGLALCVAASLGTTGCGMLFDLSYLVGSKRYDESKEERKPTGQMVTAIEYDGSIAPDGQIHLTCEERERRIERTFSVTKTYEYRGGYTRNTMIAAAVLSAVAGGAVAGIVAIGCNLPPQPGEKEPKRWSCLNALIASPFALDFGYSLIRVGMAKSPKLVDKQKNEGLVALGDIPTRQDPVACNASTERVVLGWVSGPSDIDTLNSGSSEGQKLADGALPVVLGEGDTIKLADQKEVVSAWVQNSSLGLWAVGRDGKFRSIKVNRCDALRPAISVMQGQEVSLFFQQCPPPNVQGQR